MIHIPYAICIIAYYILIEIPIDRPPLNGRGDANWDNTTRLPGGIYPSTRFVIPTEDPVPLIDELLSVLGELNLSFTDLGDKSLRQGLEEALQRLPERVINGYTDLGLD